MCFCSSRYMNEAVEEKLMMFEEKMEKSLESLKKEYMVIRAGRANPHVLDKIRVEYYGAPTPLNQVASISTPEARIIQIQPWDKGLIREIEKEINKSDIGINPNNDGAVIRLVFPELTEDRRKELTKDVKKKGEAAKVAVRNIRRDAMDALKKAGKAGDVSEDEQKIAEEDVQKNTDAYIAKIEKEIEAKTKEIMTV